MCNLPKKKKKKIKQEEQEYKKRVSRREVSKIVKCFKYKRELYPVDKGK